MNQKRPAETSPSNIGRAAEVALRSCLWRGLSAAFDYPMPDTYAVLVSRLETCVQQRALLPKRTSNVLSQVLQGLEQIGRRGYETEYLRVFTHVAAADCNPCGTTYTSSHVFQATQQLADITGFYHAFGLEAGGERPDHITVELEFMAFLSFRESMSRSEGLRRQTKMLSQGERLFMERHMIRWIGVFADLIRRKSQGGLMVCIADLLENVMAIESSRLGLSLPEPSAEGLPKPTTETPFPSSLAINRFDEGVFRE